MNVELVTRKPGCRQAVSVYDDKNISSSWRIRMLQGVLASVIDGFNCCVFAYGQTGAGKSYSVTGYGALLDRNDSWATVRLCAAQLDTKYRVLIDGRIIQS